MSPKVSQAYKEARRLNIVEAADSVFLQKGYRTATMQDVIEQVGLSRGAVYSYFENKEALYFAVMERRDESFFTELDELASSRPLWPRLIAHLTYSSLDDDSLMSSRQLMRAQYEYLIDASFDETHPDWVKSRYLRIRDSYVSILQRAADRGELHPIVPIEEVVGYFISTLEGLSVSILGLGWNSTFINQTFRLLHLSLQNFLQPESE